MPSPSKAAAASGRLMIPAARRSTRATRRWSPGAVRASVIGSPGASGAQSGASALPGVDLRRWACEDAGLVHLVVPPRRNQHAHPSSTPRRAGRRGRRASMALAPSAGSVAPQERTAGTSRRQDLPPPRPGQEVRLRQARPAGPQRLPRQPRAAHGQQRQHPRHHQCRGHQGGRCRLPGQPRQEGAQEVPSCRRHSADRRRRRPHRRQPAALRGLPRRADHRRHEPSGPRRVIGGQPRVRRGRQRAAPDGEGRLPGRRQRRQRPGLLPRWADLQGRRLPLPRRECVLEEQGGPQPAHAVQAVQDLQGRRPEGRLHRHDPRGHRHDRGPGRDR